MMLVASIWLTIYFRYIYEDDRSPLLDRWAVDEDKVSVEDKDGMELKPDLVMVFHHPCFEYADAHHRASAEAIDTVLVDRRFRERSRHMPKDEEGCDIEHFQHTQRI